MKYWRKWGRSNPTAASVLDGINICPQQGSPRRVTLFGRSETQVIG